jgi:hypothetical protein
MSRATAIIRFEDGSELFTLYNGTVDIMWNTLVDSAEDAWGWLYENYRSGDMSKLHRQCTCGQEPEPCTVLNTYGRESEWLAHACRKCKVYIGPENKWAAVDRDRPYKTKRRSPMVAEHPQITRKFRALNLVMSVIKKALPYLDRADKEWLRQRLNRVELSPGRKSTGGTNDG